METVLIVIHLIIVVALAGTILLQRSEGGALGIGGGGGGGLMSSRGSANALTKTTGVLAAAFFATSIGLSVLANVERGSSSVIDRAISIDDNNEGGLLDDLQRLDPAGSELLGGSSDGTTSSEPQVPLGQ